MSKDVKPLTPTKRTKPYTIQELAALKDAQGPRAESLLDFLGVQATVEALDEARADNAALLERLKKLEAHEGQLDRLRKELDEYKEAIKLERKGHEQRARTLEAEIESRRRWEKECEKAEAEVEKTRDDWRSHTDRMLAAEARVKELEEALRSIRLGHECADCRVAAYHERGSVGGAGYDPLRHHPSCVVHAALSTPKVKP